MKEIKLTKGKVALVSDVDYDWLSQYKWQSFIRKHKAFLEQLSVIDPDAALAFNEATAKLHGEFASLNKVG